MDRDPGPPLPAEVLYLDYAGPPYPSLSRLAAVPVVGALLKRLTSDSIFRRHPRDAEYMRNLVTHAHGAQYVQRVQQVTNPHDLDRHALKALCAVVLLWRDGNGTGWLPIELHVLRYRAEGARVLVLNGRRRQFELTPSAWAAYLLRRFLGKSLAAEALFVVAFVIATPFLFVWDRAQGRR